MEILANVIPTSSPLFKQLEQVAESTQVVVFSGLPGVGKSLYINEFQLIAKSKGLPVDVIQWDVARKAFETAYVLEHFPMGEGTVHDGLKLMAGLWLLDELELWLENYRGSDRILLIEAPLVGHRFVELAKENKDAELEEFCASDKFKVIVPIPSKGVRQKIEAERMRQVSEDAKVWSGAKPSVMLMLWKLTCGIANEMGKNVDMSGQPDYDPDIYEFVYGRILKKRHFVPLVISEVFEVPVQDEAALHKVDSIVADVETANHYGKMIAENYNSELIESIVANWYIT